MNIFNFIKKTFFFVFIFYILYGFNFLFFKKNGKDLMGIVNIYGNVSSNAEIKISNATKYYKSVDEYNELSNSKFKIINIGDSFSTQLNLGYQNFLIKDADSLLNLGDYSRNPAQELVGLFNSGFFDKTKPKYVILESVERYFVERLMDIDFEKKADISKIKEKYIRYQSAKVKAAKKKEKNFFSKETLQLTPINILFYYGFKIPLGSILCKVDTDESLFTNKNDLLFYIEDMKWASFNKNDDNLKLANDNLNIISDLLKAKGIQLIVLVCPDKYDFFYDRITDKQDFEKPLFFQKLDQLKRNYKFIKSKEILRKKDVKNMYYYYDTHWSPLAAEIIGRNIANEIK